MTRYLAGVIRLRSDLFHWSPEMLIPPRSMISTCEGVWECKEKGSDRVVGYVQRIVPSYCGDAEMAQAMENIAGRSLKSATPVRRLLHAFWVACPPYPGVPKFLGTYHVDSLLAAENDVEHRLIEHVTSYMSKVLTQER